MSEDTSEGLPFIQVHRSAMPKVARLASGLGLSPNFALGAMVNLWDMCGDPRELAKAIEEDGDGAVVVFSADDMRMRLQVAFERPVEPDILVVVGFLERVGAGYRVRGMSRQMDVIRARLAQKKRAAAGGNKRAASVRLAGQFTIQSPATHQPATSLAPASDQPGTSHSPASNQPIGESREERLLKKEEEERKAPAVKVDLQALWNANRAPELPEWRDMTPQRQRTARQRLREHPDPDAWKEAIKRINASSFCLGRNDRGWRANPDWLLRPGTLTKILEGAYDVAPAPKGRPQQPAAPPCEVCGTPSAGAVGSPSVSLCQAHTDEALAWIWAGHPFTAVRDEWLQETTQDGQKAGALQ